MRKYKAIIVDDEKPVLRLMNHVIGMNGSYSVEGTFANPHEALEAVSMIVPDVAFLDIEMPKVSGLELARMIAERSPRTRIVFSTAYRQYALDAFDVNAVDYILKPVTPASIQRVTGRLDQMFVAEPPTVEPARNPVVIRCFGAFEVRNPQGEPVRWPTRKTEELFAYFLCHPDREIGKWKLADALWPEMDEERAMNNMYNTVYRLKKAFKEQEIGMDVLKMQDGYSLDTGEADYDMAAFLRFVSSDYSGEAGQPSEEVICAAYQGKLLETKDYGWKTPIEEACRRQYESAVRALASKHLAGGEWGQAENRIFAYLKHEPLSEEMNGLLLDVYERAGYADKARKHYDAFTAAYRSEFGVEPAVFGSSKRLGL